MNKRILILLTAVVMSCQIIAGIGCGPKDPPVTDDLSEDDSGTVETLSGLNGTSVTSPEAENARPTGSSLIDVVNARQEAIEFQKAEEWTEAIDKWRQVIELIDAQTDPSSLTDLRREAENAKTNIQDAENRKVESEVAISPQQDPPETITAEDSMRYYRPGRNTRSTAVTRITGKGLNKGWIFQQECGFLYIYRVVSDTKVLHNTDGRIVFEQKFVEVEQERAAWDLKKVSIREFGPLPKAAFQVVEEVFLNQVPLYLRLKQVGEVINQIDPGGEKILKRATDLLYTMGLNAQDLEHVDLVAQIETLHGSTFHVVYETGHGVTKITAVGETATKFDKEELKRIALGTSLMADYYIFPGAKKQPGDKWSIRADQFSGMLNLYDCELHGEVTLARESDDTLDGKPVAVLKIQGGEVTAVGGERSVTVRPESGVFYFYNPTPAALETGEVPLVKKGRIQWHATDTWVSQGHLLFGTERVQDLDMSTEYRAAPLRTAE